VQRPGWARLPRHGPLDAQQEGGLSRLCAQQHARYSAALRTVNEEEAGSLPRRQPDHTRHVSLQALTPDCGRARRCARACWVSNADCWNDQIGQR
jgi:hypothetical protein